jgi:hypothetical protein
MEHFDIVTPFRDACDDNALHCAIQSKNVDVIRVIRKGLF